MPGDRLHVQRPQTTAAVHLHLLLSLRSVCAQSFWCLNGSCPLPTEERTGQEEVGWTAAAPTPRDTCKSLCTRPPIDTWLCPRTIRLEAPLPRVRTQSPPLKGSLTGKPGARHPQSFAQPHLLEKEELSTRPKQDLPWV